MGFESSGVQLTEVRLYMEKAHMVVYNKHSLTKNWYDCSSDIYCIFLTDAEYWASSAAAAADAAAAAVVHSCTLATNVYFFICLLKIMHPSIFSITSRVLELHVYSSVVPGRMI